MIFSFIKRHFNKNKKFIFSLVLFFGIFFLLRDFAFAENSANSTQTNTTDWKKTADWLKLIFSVSAALIGVLTSLVSLLLFPGWTSGNIIGLDTYMKEIWVLVSNVVYFIFAFILIYIAVMNIVGQGKDTYQLKTALPRFIIGVLIVPFSWFFVQFILSIAAFLSVASLSLPYSTFQGMDSFTNALKDKKICSKYELHLGSGSGTTTGTGVGEGNYDIGDVLICRDLKNVENVVNGEDQKSLYGLIYLYTYGILSLDKLDEFNSNQINNVQTFLDAIQKVLFDMIFIVVYVILMFALFIALFVRGFMFWIYAMASPVIGLSYFLKKKDGGGIMKHFNITQIIHLALVPVYVCLALSFGYLFLLVAGEGMETGKINTIIRDGKYEFAGFTLDINGAFGDTSTGQTANKKLISGFGSIIGKIIIELFGIAIIRLAIMAALKMADVTKSATESIAKLGRDAGNTIARLPAITPIPGTGGLSASGLSHISGRLESKISTMGSDKGEDFIKQNPFLREVLNGGKGGEIVDALKGLKEAISKDKKELISEESAKLLGRIGSVGKLLEGDRENVEQIAEGLVRQGYNKAKVFTEAYDKKDEYAMEKAIFEAHNWQLDEGKSKTGGTGILGSEKVTNQDQVERVMEKNGRLEEENKKKQTENKTKNATGGENPPAPPAPPTTPPAGGTPPAN